MLVLEKKQELTTGDEIVARVEKIQGFVRERRYELALTLIESLEEDLATIEDPEVTQPVRDLVHASRMFTESLIRLQQLQRH